MDYTSFIDEAQQVQQTQGIPASIILGQLLLESGRELSGLAIKGKNLFGVKGEGSAGSVYMPTKEFQGGQLVTTTGKFAAYESYYDSLLDHARILKLPRYTKYTESAQTIEEYAKGIKAGGYATDPDYASKLVNVIKSYKLDQYDDKSKWTSTGAIYPQNTNKTVKPWQRGTSQAAATGEGSPLAAGILRVLMLGLLVIFSIVFLMKAFPVTSDVIDTGVKAGKVAATVITKKKGA